MRSEGNLFGGLWGCPLAEGRGKDKARALAETLALEGTLGARKLGRVEHVLTHRKLSVDVYGMEQTTRGSRAKTSAATGSAGAHLKAVREEELVDLGIAKLTRKILAVAGGDG